MTSEIKEILGYLAFFEDIDTQKKVKQVADYIAKLQEENTEIIRKINKTLYKNRKAREIYENSSSIIYKKKRFMEGKTTADLMYEALKGE